MSEITTERYVRKPFEIDAVQVTRENIHDVAKWCDGDLHLVRPVDDDTAADFIKVNVNRPLNERQTKAFVGDWVLRMGTSFKVYTDHAFTKSFELAAVDALF